ncbi:O-antigen ligase family protein [bacterium SCSIO 12741]|nr:O-antigen ligase family protein [bacterium SCSIO 12741]
MMAQSQDKFARNIAWVLIAILFLKVGSYFTVSESIVITRVVKVIVRLMATGWLILVLKQLQNRGNVTSFHWQNQAALFFYFGYLFLGLCSLLWSTKPGYSLLQLTMNTESFLFGFLFIKTYLVLRDFYPQRATRFSALLAPALFFILAIFVIGLFVNPDTFYRLTHGGEEARLGGYFMNPNELGMLAVIGLACSGMELYLGAPKVKHILMMAVMLFALVKTGSRSSMIGLALILGYFIFISKNRKLKLGMVAAGIAAVPLVVNTIIIKHGGLDEVLSMTGRLPFWKALLSEGLPKEPLFGFGYMRIAYTDAFQSVHTYAGKMTHNTFIQVLMNLGFVGFSIVLVQMIFTFSGVRKLSLQADRLFFIGLIIPLLINSFTEFGIFGETNFGILFYQLLIWLLVVKRNPLLTLKQKVILRKKRPDLYQSWVKG